MSSASICLNSRAALTPWISRATSASGWSGCSDHDLRQRLVAALKPVEVGADEVHQRALLVPEEQIRHLDVLGGRGRADADRGRAGDHDRAVGRRVARPQPVRPGPLEVEALLAIVDERHVGVGLLLAADRDCVLVAHAVMEQRLVLDDAAARLGDRDLDVSVPRAEVLRHHDPAGIGTGQPHLHGHGCAVGEAGRRLELQPETRAVLDRLAPAFEVLQSRPRAERIAAHDHVLLEPVADVHELGRVEPERECAPERARPAREAPGIVHPRRRRGPVRLRRGCQRLLPRVEQVEAVPELVDARIGLQPPGVRRRPADTGVEDGAALPLLALLVEHDPVEACAEVVQPGVEEPHRPLGHVAPAGEVAHHRGVQLRIAPGAVRARLRGRDHVVGARREQLHPGLGVRSQHGERPRRPTGRE